MGNTQSPFQLPFIRWANTAYMLPGHGGVINRRLYDHEFIYVLKGQGHMVVDGRAYDALPDRLFLIQPHVWHSFTATNESDFLVIGIHFDWIPRPDTTLFHTYRPAEPPFEDSLFREPQEITGWNLRSMPFLELSGRPRVRRMLEEVIVEYGRGDAEARAIAGALLAAAISQIEREVRLLRELKQNAPIGADAVRRVQRAREILEKAQEHAVTIEAVAAQVGWSGDHLRRMFRTVLNTSPNQIQTAARIRRAQELLRYESLPITEIARRCGFDDPSHFTRVFKKQTGAPPREWLALARTNQD